MRCPSLAGVGVVFYVLSALRAHLCDQGWFTAEVSGGDEERHLGEVVEGDPRCLGHEATVSGVVAVVGGVELDHDHTAVVLHLDGDGFADKILPPASHTRIAAADDSMMR